jgi:thiamine-monophosphate kinase
MKLKDIGEIGLINRFAGNIRCDRSVVKGIGDDAAVIKWTRGKYLIYTCDMTIEDVHFRLKDASPYRIGWKALARNISDIAAMGGMPRYALVSAALDPNLPVSFADGLYKGIKACARMFGVNIVGGDTAKSEKVTLDISLIGEVEKKNLVLRSGAKAGDVILVTGSIGGAFKGHHLDFIPRVNEARELVKRFKINSMIDVSDGLILDLERILKASNKAATIFQNAVPMSKDAGSFESAVSDGEDFELLFTMNVKEAKRFFRTYLSKMKTPVTLIGEIEPREKGYKLSCNDGKLRRLDPKGYVHFK